jgi:hypothetical protein
MKISKFKTGGIVLLASMFFVLPQAANAGSKNILSYGSTYSQSDYGNGEAVAKVRLVQEGSIRYWQVRLPGGFWDSCDGDCAEAYRLKLLDFWEENDNRHGNIRNN